VRPIALLAIAAVCISAGSFSAQQAGPPATPSKIDFVRDVQPILQEHCYECHGPDKQMNGLRLDRRRDAMRGGTLTVIGPGSAESSRLYLRLIGTRYGRKMPIEGDPLTPAQVDIVKNWIDKGAEWPDAASGDAPMVPPDAAAVTAFRALRGGDRAAFLAALRGNPNISTLRGAAGMTPLMMAALYGDAALVKDLLDQGASPNAWNDAGATALMWSVGDLETVKLLVDRGADVKARSNDGRSAIVIAAGIRGSHDVVSFLLDKGSNPSFKAPGNLAGVTPIGEAAKEGDEATLRLLIARGGDVAAAGFQPLAMALRQECDGCVDALIDKLPKRLFTPAMILASPPRGPALATIAMLEHGADANGQGPAGYPILLLAAASAAQPLAAVKALLDRGADINARGPYGETALGLARRHGHTPVVDLLVQAGARDDAADTAPPATIAFAPAHSAREAIARSVPLLQHADEVFLQKSGCVSCHNNSQTAMTLALVRPRGIPVDETIARRQLARIASYMEDWRERALQGAGIGGESATISTILLGLAAERYPSDAITDAFARYVRQRQSADGRWRGFAHRPPIESGDVKETASAMRVLQLYAPPFEKKAADEAVVRGAAWLRQARPANLQERAYQLLGLGWSRAGKDAIQDAAHALVAQQRADGGWAQIPTLESDAYATGEALVALVESGALALSDPAYKRGVAFLLRTQLADGSWLVRTRAIPIQPYFDAGFPHGKDQFISAAATNWATQALTYVAANKGT
jgi:ankyrin repeat protein